jgi:hypothetical protein
MANADPADLLQRMITFGTKLFAVPKEKATEEEAKRPKRRGRTKKPS